ncbi:nucleotidyltransferase family protein [Candidatus Pristimantibacillus sp. PTI5]|uniref:nucleotidyltransferase domain-containing protein n=1 Tax=Candidatus Pristimantibacillus sp. PTI5 TaxID=3400422 RepID=UPI003B01A05F
MNKSEAVTLISRIYQNQCPLFDSEETAKAAVDDIDIFQVAPQVYYLLKSRGLLEAVPSEQLSRLKSGVDAVLFQNMLIRSEMYKLLEAFERSGIQVIVMKGIRLSERFFGHFSGRGTSDIDLLVRPEDLDKAVSLLERHEFIRYIEDDADHFHMLLNKFYANEDFPLLGVELHWNILREHVSDTDMSSFWMDAEPISPYEFVKELSAKDTFYYLCLHGYNHNMLSLKYVIDILHILRCCSAEIDYGQLFAQAKHDGNYAKVLIALTIVYDLFPELHELKPLNVRRRWPLWNIELMRNAQFGIRNWRFYGFHLFSAFVAYDSVKQQWAHLRYLLLPPRDYALDLLKYANRSDVPDSNEPMSKIYAKIYKRRLQFWLKTLRSKQKKN